MAPYEALYGRRCRSPVHWDEVGERILLGPELMQQTVDIVLRIRDMMRTTQSRQKSYADRRRRDLEFTLGDHVFVRVTPMKDVMCFGKRGKISPRFIGPFEILERICTLAYRVALPPSLAAVHNVFHVSMLRKYISNPSHVFDFEPLHLALDLSFEERPVQILEREERKLRTRVIPMVKVRWLNHSEEEATWEAESDMQKHYPDLFDLLKEMGWDWSMGAAKGSYSCLKVCRGVRAGFLGRYDSLRPSHVARVSGHGRPKEGSGRTPGWSFRRGSDQR
ncbi:uncharacterized protein [Henckelia pumila]|uniref:uncharacterized protein n=1 Tax=Henckelia pumila TaxID=405737 RepID=UPI003C6E1268